MDKFDIFYTRLSGEVISLSSTNDPPESLKVDTNTLLTEIVQGKIGRMTKPETYESLFVNTGSRKSFIEEANNYLISLLHAFFTDQDAFQTSPLLQKFVADLVSVLFVIEFSPLEPFEDAVKIYSTPELTFQESQDVSWYEPELAKKFLFTIGFFQGELYAMQDGPEDYTDQDNPQNIINSALSSIDIVLYIIRSNNRNPDRASPLINLVEDLLPFSNVNKNIEKAISFLTLEDAKRAVMYLNQAKAELNG
jgi:hypothetical protein